MLKRVLDKPHIKTCSRLIYGKMKRHGWKGVMAATLPPQGAQLALCALYTGARGMLPHQSAYRAISFVSMTFIPKSS